MSFPRYDSYKDSGVEWLGEFPATWNATPFKKLFKRIKRTGYVEAELLSVYRDYGVIRKSDRNDNYNNPSDDLATYQLVRPGDLAVNKMKAWQGSLGISAYEGIVSPAYFVFEPKTSFCPDYMNYLLRSRLFANGFMLISKGIRPNQWDIDPEHLAQVPLIIPTLAEQIAISAFLDRETAKIDGLIEAQRRLIELLKEKRQAVISHAVTKGLDPTAPMRSSRVEWMGDVPAHWKVRRLRQVATIQTGIAKGKDVAGRKTTSVPYLRVANVQDGYLDLNEITRMEVPKDDVGRYLLKRGDVLMNEGGDFDKLGRGDVWEGQIDPCIHQNHVFAIRPFGVSTAWLAMLTRAGYAQFFFMSRSKQSTNLASISSTNLMDLPVPVPPIEEATRTLEYLTENLARNSSLIHQAQSAITLLQERRSALISAAVTGKIDVRGLASAPAEAATAEAA